MMKSIYNLFILVAFSALWFTFSGNSSGAGGGGGMTLTGAPFDGGTCANCHGGGVYGTVTPTISVFEVGTTTVVSNYVGGRAYDVRLAITASSGTPYRYGFQLVAANASEIQAGSWSNFPSGTLGTNLHNRTYVEQTTPQNVNSFTFRWTAPATSVGTVTFYAVGNCVNGNSGTGGDRVGTGSLALPAQNHTGLESLKNILLFEARPTVSNGHFVLHLDLQSEQNMRLETYNMMGQRVYQQQIRGKNLVEAMDWSHLSAGKYMLKLHTSEGIATCAIVITP